MRRFSSNGGESSETSLKVKYKAIIMSSPSKKACACVSVRRIADGTCARGDIQLYSDFHPSCKSFQNFHFTKHSRLESSDPETFSSRVILQVFTNNLDHFNVKVFSSVESCCITSREIQGAWLLNGHCDDGDTHIEIITSHVCISRRQVPPEAAASLHDWHPPEGAFPADFFSEGTLNRPRLTRSARHCSGGPFGKSGL
jgi:hypothetical protein